MKKLLLQGVLLSSVLFSIHGCDFEAEAVVEKRSEARQTLMEAHRVYREAESEGKYEKYSKARGLYLQAAEGGVPEAMYYFAKFCDEGLAGSIDGKLAATWYLRAAEQGDDMAMFALAEKYHAGNTGIDKDIGKAVGWYSKAAESGNAQAMFALGQMSYEKGTAQDLVDAGMWFQKALEPPCRCPDAAYYLGRMYERGEMGDNDMFKAIAFYQRAAIVWHSKAMIRLGDIYSEMEGDSENRILSSVWYRMAMSYGDNQARVEAEKKYVAIIETLTFQEKKQCDDLVSKKRAESLRIIQRKSQK